MEIIMLRIRSSHPDIIPPETRLPMQGYRVPDGKIIESSVKPEGRIAPLQGIRAFTQLQYGSLQLPDPSVLYFFMPYEPVRNINSARKHEQQRSTESQKQFCLFVKSILSFCPPVKFFLNTKFSKP